MDNKFKVLGIDYSLTGSAFVWNDSYTFFSDKKNDAKDTIHCQYVIKESTPDDKLDNVITHFLNLIDKIHFDLIVLEAPSFNSKNTSNSFQAGYGLIQYFARKDGIPYLLIPPISSKLYFTGNAKAEKIDMVDQAIKEFGKRIDFENVSKKHREDIADASSLYGIGIDYLNCERMPAPKGCVDTQDVKYFDTLLLHRQQVIAKLRGRLDLYEDIKKIREKQKRSKNEN